MINRLILWLSLAGMILALHLWIQKARGFDQGCLGLSQPAQVAEGGCLEVSDLPASHLFGVSNAAWGYAFYFGLAVLSFAKILARSPWAQRLHRLGEVAVGCAVLYSGYLVYHMVVAEAFCVLCLTSSGLVGTLFALHVWVRRRGGFQPVADDARALELGMAMGAVFAAAGVLVGVLILVNRLGTRPLDQGNGAREFQQMVGNALPAFIDPKKLAEMRTCRFDDSAPPIELKKFARPDTPFIGRPDGTPVVAFFDPNCGHCAAYFPRFVQVAEQFKGRARIMILPRALWDYSLPAISALLLVESPEQYFELWRRMFERAATNRDAMTVDEIRGLFQEQGLDTSNLEHRLVAARVEAEALRARAKAAGIRGVPALYVDGRRVWGANLSEACVTSLIEQTSAGRADAAPR